MSKKVNTKLTKLVKYYTLINHNLILSNKSINRYLEKNLAIPKDKARKLEDWSQIDNVKNCKLKENADKLVFSDGNPESKIMIIGEGPGANEDKEGLPFVGKAGQLLDKMLNAISLSRKNVYITNVVNFRPPEQKTLWRRSQKISSILKKHISISPQIILLLGSTAMNGNWKCRCYI